MWLRGGAGGVRPVSTCNVFRPPKLPRRSGGRKLRRGLSPAAAHQAVLVRKLRPLTLDPPHVGGNSWVASQVLAGFTGGSVLLSFGRH